MSVVQGLLLVGVLAVAAVAIYAFAMARKTRHIAAEAERLVPKTGKSVTVLGETIHYIEAGKGRPILLVHGLGGHHHHMRPIFEGLAGEYRLIAIDRPGSGYSSRADTTEARLTAQARQIAGVIDALKLDRPLLVGHSLGGAVALATALDFPAKISGLALISPLTHHRDTLPPEFRALYIPNRHLRRLIANTVAVPASVKAAEQTLAFVFGPQKPPEDYAVGWGALLGLRPSHFYAASTDMVAIGQDLPRQQTRYGELKMPVGMLFGEADRVLDIETHGRAMRGKIAGLDFEELPGIGHMPQFAVPDRVLAFVRRMAEKAFAERVAIS